jgi:uncharacterized membrane protein YdbT with pleckstrin-like domain
MSFSKHQLLPGEELILLSRQHLLALLKPVLLNLIILAIIIALYILQLHREWILLFCLVPLAYLLLKVFDWKQREYILTNRRVVKQEGVFSVSSFDAPLDKINNVFHRQTLMGRLFKYGDVGLETASEQGTTVFDFLAQPLGFKNSLVHQRELYIGINSSVNTTQLQNIPKLIEELASLRERNIISAEEFEEKKRTLLEKI